ncbi:hypothetical protein VC83_03589 [Pseudogymnoascus destructans]|uniref:Uncharacterized protein n=1 Tax=Pseudogymnoascus destructans TaxID=655981 RepID=A0A177AHM6_9PEZI|nr:uncharacterized protein VC83_03589 [Pseudogymnoascus destructans]OAF60684.1 hypothetical protein VC83_03589 [Pseudogymnoascus destructans]
MAASEKRQWIAEKSKGKRLFAPELGGSYEVFNKRPLQQEMALYCTQDMKLMPKLWQLYSSRLSQSWAKRVEIARKDRIAMSTYNWLEKELQVKELHEKFIQAINKFVYRTNTTALVGLEEEGAGELLRGKSEEVKINIMSLFHPLLPPPPKVMDVIRPRTLLPSPPLCPHQQANHPEIGGQKFKERIMRPLAQSESVRNVERYRRGEFGASATVCVDLVDPEEIIVTDNEELSQKRGNQLDDFYCQQSNQPDTRENELPRKTEEDPEGANTEQANSQLLVREAKSRTAIGSRSRKSRI